MRVKLSLFIGGFYPFLGCPALFLRPSTAGVKTGIAGREKEREGGWGKNSTLVTATQNINQTLTALNSALQLKSIKMSFNE